MGRSIEPPHHPFSFYAWRPSAVVAPTCKICWPFLKLVKARITSWLMTSSALFQSLLKPRTICCTRAAAQHKLSRFNSYSGLSNSCEFELMLTLPTRASAQISVFKALELRHNTNCHVSTPTLDSVTLTAVSLC